MPMSESPRAIPASARPPGPTRATHLVRPGPGLIAGMVLLLACNVAAASGPALDMVAEDEAAAVFAGGCFWCVESDFDGVPGVLRTVSGYTGGHLENPGYRDVTAGGTGHREAVLIVYDPEQVSYERLLHVFWRSVDPTDAGGQFCDRGASYATAVFARDEMQRTQAEASRAALDRAGILPGPIVTPVETFQRFYPAEDYHQDYYRKNPIRYRVYRYSCGRDERVEELWGDQAHDGIESH